LGPVSRLGLVPCPGRAALPLWHRRATPPCPPARRRGPSLAPRRPWRTSLIARAVIGSRGIRFEPSDVRLERLLGEGSFGSVFEGRLKRFDGETEHVVVKRVKQRVAGADEMGQMEHLLNVFVSKCAPGVCADFRGYIEATPETATPGIVEGLWLVWKYEGRHTLSYFLRRKDTLQALATAMGVSTKQVVPVAMRQILEACDRLHSLGLVHRDVKPLNIIVAEDIRRLKLIDLGACADLRSGTNFNPAEAILDPLYCPPEQYVVPVHAPHLAKHNRLQQAMMGPVMWLQHKPDRFDVYAAGLILMQLAVPMIRSDRGLKTFSDGLRQCKYNLSKWRKRNMHALQGQTDILDMDGGAGWDLAAKMLLPRSFGAEGYRGMFSVMDVVDPQQTRISISEALAHPFLSPPTSGVSPELPDAGASVPAPEPRPATLFARLANRVNGIAANMRRVESATQRQTMVVKALTKRAQAGDEVGEELAEAKEVLKGMEGSLAFMRKLMDEAMGALTTASQPGRGRESEGPTAAEALIKEASAAAASTAASAEKLGATFTKRAAGAITGGLVGGFNTLTSSALRTGGSLLGSLIEGLDSLQRRAAAVEAERAFLGLLNEELRDEVVRDPEAEWDVVEAKIESFARYGRVPAARREALFAQFKAMVLESLQKEKEATEEAFRAMVLECLGGPEGVAAAQGWDTARAAMKRDPRFRRVTEEREREELFTAVYIDCVKVVEVQQQTREAEAAFLELLRSLRDPSLSPSDTWAAVRRRVRAEPQYSGVPEEKRRAELFESFTEELRARQQEAEDQEASAVREAAEALAMEGHGEAQDMLGDTASTAEKLRRLREEHARTMGQYEAVMSKLETPAARGGRRE